MPAYSKILIPVDFSDYSREALRQACDVARHFDAELHLLHVLESWPAPATVTAEFRPQYTDVFVEQRTRAVKALDELPAPELGPKPVIRVVRTGHAVQEITTYASEAGIDLIVLATHGRTGIAHWLMGSVAEKVVQHAPCAVLVVRRPQRNQPS
jgi:universal stress protein A